MRVFQIIFVNMFLMLALGEGITRLFQYRPLQMNTEAPMADAAWGLKDSRLGWINNPGTHRSVEPGHVPMTFWSDGERASASTEPPAADPKPKLLIIGDSWSQAYGVTDPESFGWLVQEGLTQFTFHNYGTGGHGVVQSWMMLDRYYSTHAKDSSPVLVIFAFTVFMNERNTPTIDRISSLRTFANDVYWPPFAVRAKDGTYHETAPYSSSRWPFEQHSAFFSLLHDTLLKADLWLKEDEAQKLEVSTEYIHRMNDLARQHHSNFLFVWLAKGNVFEAINSDLRKAGISVVDCQHPDDFIPRLRVGGIGHPNGEYHSYIAACILDYLRKNPELLHTRE